ALRQAPLVAYPRGARTAFAAGRDARRGQPVAPERQGSSRQPPGRALSASARTRRFAAPGVMKLMPQPREVRRPPPEQPSGSLRLVSHFPALEVQEVQSRWEFAGLELEWNQLAKDAGPFNQHRFLRIWLDNFAPHARLRILLARDRGALIGALPLM